MAGVEMYGGLGDRSSFGLARNLALSGPGHRLESAFELDVALVARIWTQRQQPSVPVTLGRFAGVFRIRFDRGELVWGRPMIRSAITGQSSFDHGRVPVALRR